MILNLIGFLLLTKMTHIFISYSRVDKKFTKALAELLSHAYDHVWYDTARLVGGDDWWAKILTEIDHCDYFVFLLSTESLASEYCQKELMRAIELNKHIIPIQIRDRVDITDNLLRLQIIKMLDEVTVDGLNSLYSAIIRNSNSNNLYLNNSKKIADHLLLQRLWKCINTSNIEILDWQITHQRMLPSAVFHSTISNYFRIRKRVENHFNNPNLEDIFGAFDVALENFRETFGQLSKGDNFEGEHYFTVAFELGMERDFWEEKYNAISERIGQLRQCHGKLIEIIRSIYPEFDFTTIEE